MLFVLKSTWNFSKYRSGQPCTWHMINNVGDVCRYPDQASVQILVNMEQCGHDFMFIIVRIEDFQKFQINTWPENIRFRLHSA